MRRQGGRGRVGTGRDLLVSLNLGAGREGSIEPGRLIRLASVEMSLVATRDIRTFGPFTKIVIEADVP